MQCTFVTQCKIIDFMEIMVKMCERQNIDSKNVRLSAAVLRNLAFHSMPSFDILSNFEKSISCFTQPMRVVGKWESVWASNLDLTLVGFSQIWLLDVLVLVRYFLANQPHS